MENVDLNLDNYTINDLEEFFSLPSMSNYDMALLTKKKQDLCTGMFADLTLENKTKTNLHQFLERAYDRLAGHVRINATLAAGAAHPANPITHTTLTNATAAASGSANSNSNSNSNSAVTMGQDQFPQFTNVVKETNGHFLIENPSRDGVKNYDQTPGLTIDQHGAPAGILNPIRYQTIKRALNIDTRFRPHYYTTKSTDIHITLPTKFEKVVSMRVASVEIPMTFHAISDALGNNVINIMWKVGGTQEEAYNYDAPTILVIPDGNYESYLASGATATGAASIEKVINDLLLAAPAGQPPLNMRFSIDRASGRSIFAQDASSVPYPFMVTFNSNRSGVVTDATPLPLTLGWALGFRGAQYESWAPGNPNILAVVSEGIAHIHGPQYVFLAIDDYNNSSNNYFASAFANSIAAPNIIARIGLAGMMQDAKVYNLGHEDGLSTQLNRSRSYFGPVDISKLRITLYDDFGRVLNLNNMDWSLALMFECVYE